MLDTSIGSVSRAKFPICTVAFWKPGKAGSTMLLSVAEVFLGLFSA